MVLQPKSHPGHNMILRKLNCIISVEICDKEGINKNQVSLIKLQ